MKKENIDSDFKSVMDDLNHKDVEKAGCPYKYYYKDDTPKSCPTSDPGQCF